MGRRKLIEDDQLLAKVRDIVVREGTGVASRKIADEIGISESVLFQRFGSKEELLFAALAPPAPEMETLLQEGAYRGRARAHLEQIAVELLDYFREFVPVLLPLATHPSFEYEAFRERHPDAPLEKLTAQLMETMDEKRQRGEIDCPDVGMIVLNLLAVANSLAMYERIGVHGGEFSESTVRNLARLVWQGIAPAGQRESGARVHDETD